MKKCKYCGTELTDDTLFCTECGKPVSQDNVCPHCGASMNEGDAFCQNCGQRFFSEKGSNIKQEVIIQEGTSRSSKIKYIIPLVILLALVIGAWFMLHSGETNNPQNRDLTEAVTDSIDVSVDPNDVHSEAFIKKRIEEVCKAMFEVEEEKVIEKYFSSEFRKMYKTIGELERSGKGGDGLWYSGGFLDGSSESTYKATVGNINNIEDCKANVDLVIHSGESSSNEYGKYIINVPLVFEDGNWFLDDICNRRSDMAEYIDYMMNNDDSDEIKSIEELAETNTAIGAFDVKGDDNDSIQ